MEGLFDKIKKDVKKGFEEGFAAVVQGQVSYPQK